MSAKPAEVIWRKNRLRADLGDAPAEASWKGREGAGQAVALAVVLGAACLFVLAGAGRLDVGPLEARAGMAAAGPVGPLGQVYGSWDPQQMPARYLPAWAWAWVAGEPFPGTDAVRWPGAIAAVALGLVVASQAARALGTAAGIAAGGVVLSSLLLMDRSAVGLGLLDAWLGTAFYRLTGSSLFLLKPIAPEVDLIAGLGVTAALGRVLSGRADRWAGLWAAVGFLGGGWPALVAVALPIAAVRRFDGPSDREEGWGWLAPALGVAAAWSVWCWLGARPEAWFAAMVRPLTRPMAVTLPLWAVVYALPLGPLSALTISPSVRANWSRPGRAWIARWTQAIGVLLLAGMVIPGLGDAARVPLVCGLAMLAGAGLSGLATAWSHVGSRVRRGFHGLGGAVVVPTVALGLPLAGYLAAAVPYYRPPAISLMVLLAATGLAWALGAGLGARRLALGALVGLALGWKLAHAGLHVPEWNYRASQGPWGRAIGQWIPRSSALYFVNPSAFDPASPPRDRWPADLAFYTGRRVRQIPSPTALDLEPGPGPHFVLLHPTEFEHWPKAAPALIKVRELQDAFGMPRVLARTEGPLYPDRRKELGE